MKKAMLMTLAVTTAATALSANLVWVGGAEGDWNDAQNWDPQQIPTQNDTVFFDSAESITVNLGAEQAHGTLSVSNTPCLFFRGLETGSRMDVRNDSKWTLYAPVVFDENTYVKFIAGKVWTNNSTIDFLGGVGANNSAVTLGGTGLYKVRGPVDFPAGVTLSAPIDWDPSSVTDETFYQVSSCDWQFNGEPHVEGHLVRFSGGTGGFGGVAPLTVKSPDDTRPSAGFNNYANPNLRVNRTMPTVFEDWFALCLANACNNNKVGFQLGSGANLWIPADITTANVRNFVSESPTGGFKLNFQGCGANIRLTGDNSFQGGGGSATELICGNGCGYNSIEIDGEGNTIHPFGAADGKLYSNTGHGVFIRPMRPGLTLANGLLYGNSVNNNNAYTFGFDGTNDLTIVGDLVMGTGNSMVPVIGDMTLTLTGTIDPKATHLDFVGTGDAVLAPTSQFTGSTGTLQKHSAGSLTLQGALAGTSYNRAYFAGGRTILDYSVGHASRLNTANSANLDTPAALADALRLRGTELVLKGGAFAETVGAGNGTTFQNGLTKIRRDSGTSTIHLGAITPSATASHGSIVAVDVADGVATVDSSLAGQNLKGAFTVDGDHFAAVDADGVITKAGDGIATKFTGDDSTTRTVVDYIIIEPTAAGQTLTLGAASNPLIANKDGIIFRGDYDYTIEGGYIGGANTYNGGLVFTCAGTGVLTFSGKIDRYGFAKTGPGTFKLTGTSALTQSLAIYEGVFDFASTSGDFTASGKGSVFLNGGTLRTSVDATLTRPLSVGDNGGVIEVVANTVFTQTGTTVTTTDGTSGPIVKRGTGTWLPSGEMTAQSELRIEEGTVKLGHASGIGNSTSQTRAVAPTKIFANGMLDVAGFAAHVGNVYLKGGKIIDSATGGSLGAYTFYAESGEVAVPLTDVRCPNNSNYLFANNLEKIGPDTAKLTAANEYTGTTFVRDGILELTGSLAGTAWIEGGILTGSGSIAGYTYVDGGAILAASGSSLTLGDNLAFGPGGRLAVSGIGERPGVISLTAPGALLHIDEEAAIDFLAKGSGGIGSLVGEHVIVEMPENGRVVGEFAGFTNGKATDRFGNRYAISYAAGDGNDIAITGIASGTVIFLK